MNPSREVRLHGRGHVIACVDGTLRPNGFQDFGARWDWYVLSGEGEIWRSTPDGHENITRLIPRVCVDIPLGTAFQYRCTGNVSLVFTCTALPPWPGDYEAVIVDGPWVPRLDPEPRGQRSD
jgi:hypothetical protein